MNKLLREWWRRVCRVLSVAFVLCGIPTMVSAQKVLLTQVPLQLYDAETGRLEATWPGRGTASMFTADGRYVLTPSGMGGLQVIDITNPASPQIVGSVDTPGYAYGVATSGTHACVADDT